ncbi:MAG: polynucleotide adenylyltransferase PcnB [Candidatus Algichlamydia australiensis]|nr:polynucleotide adenylyltransferase PcnB [Chlamydiales bacterium]
MDPKTYSKEEHGIDINNIDAHALYVLDKLRLAGFKAYLVGGGVRDLLLGIKPKDYDISTSAKPEEVKKIFRNCLLIGRRFRLAHVRFGRKIIEVSTFRAGDTQNESLILRDNIFGTPEEDVLRRDFTINGLFYDSEKEEVIDFVEGYPDIKKRFLRTIGQSFVRFKQDPVRMIRLLKFIARFGLDADTEARQALLECRAEILKSAQARVLEEILRMLESGSSAPFFKLMAEHGLLEEIMPALAEFLESDEGADVYSYLEEIDRSNHEPHHPKYHRATLVSGFLFPLFEDRLHRHYLSREKIPHLGDIFEEAHALIDEVFKPFFLFPKRIRAQVTNILTNQYRITPLDPKRPRRIRIPTDPEFFHSLDFLNLRVALKPTLQPICNQWKEAFDKGDRPKPRSRSGAKRNRPRRRKKS